MKETLKEFRVKLHVVYFVVLEGTKVKNLTTHCGQVAEFKFESKIKPLMVIWPSLSSLEGCSRSWQKLIEALSAK